MAYFKRNMRLHCSFRNVCSVIYLYVLYIKHIIINYNLASGGLTNINLASGGLTNINLVFRDNLIFII